MNTLRNLKILKTSSKSYANKINLTLFTNLNKNNNIQNILRNSLSQANNRSIFENKLNKTPLLITNQKKSFATKSFYEKNQSLESTDFNSELENESNNETLNFNLLYNAESTSEESDINKILSKLEDTKILRHSKKQVSSLDADKMLLEKNMLYVAMLDIHKRFPLKNQYEISHYEKFIKAKLFIDLNNRKNLEDFASKLESDSNDLNAKIKSFVKHYKNDELGGFVNSLGAFIEALQKETKEKYSEFYFVKFNEEIASLSNYLKSLMDKHECNYYSEHLYNINNKALISLMNELQVIAIEGLGKAEDFTAEFAKLNEDLILEAISKYNLSDFDAEKTLHFKTLNYASLFKPSVKKAYFTSDFLLRNLIPFITNSISVLGKQYGENSVDVATFSYMLAYINLRLKNYEKAEEYAEKCFQIYSSNKANFQVQQEENIKQSILNEITYLRYLYIKSQLVGVHVPNKKETYLTLKQASELIESIESKYYSAIGNSKNKNFTDEFSLEKIYDFSALKLKVNYNLALYYKQYNFVLDQQTCFEKCIKINPFTLKTNRRLMQQYNTASKFLLELYENLGLKRNIYDLAKRNFALAYYTINNKAEQAENLSLYAGLLVKNINSSFDKFNYLTLLNPKSKSFNFFKSNQENFVLSLISYFQYEENNYAIGSVLSEYLQVLTNTDPLQAETFENTYQILLSFYVNINSPSANYAEANKSLVKLRDHLQLEEFMQEELKSFETKKQSEHQSAEALSPGETSSQSLNEADESRKELDDKFYFYRKNKDSYNHTVNLAVSVNYNIIMNLIKSNEYEEALVAIDFLLNFLNKLNENKTFGSVIEHPYLLINLNFLAAHYHLIKNQKLYSVKYLKEVNSMITKFDWGSNTQINAYLTEMVKLINSI